MGNGCCSSGKVEHALEPATTDASLLAFPRGQQVAEQGRRQAACVHWATALPWLAQLGLVGAVERPLLKLRPTTDAGRPEHTQELSQLPQLRHSSLELTSSLYHHPISPSSTQTPSILIPHRTPSHRIAPVPSLRLLNPYLLVVCRRYRPS